MQTLQNPFDYLNNLIVEIDKADNRILIQTMNFEYGKIVGRLETHLIKAAKRGIDVRINYDWVAKKYIHGDLSMFPTINRSKRSYGNKIQDKNEEMYARLKKAGIVLVRTNDPVFPISQFPYLGRSHIKMAVIDEKICWVGGINLYDGAFENTDIMVKSGKYKLISALSKQFFQVNENKGTADYKVEIDKYDTLYVDTGRKGKSIIHDHAIKRIRNARKNIIFMSQFVPDTKLLKEITDAGDRNVKTIILTSPSDDTIFTHYPEKLSYVVLKITIDEKGNIELNHLSKKVHAKIIIIDDEMVLFGSHNYTYSGVLFGTAEIMIESKEEMLIRQFRKLIKDSIKVNN